MIDKLVTEPVVVAAIVSGIVSLLIAGGTAIGTVWAASRKISKLRTETMTSSLASARTERFLKAHDAYVMAYTTFEAEMRNTQLQPDGQVKRLNLITALYAEHSRDLVNLYGDFIPAKIVSLKEALQSEIDQYSRTKSPIHARNFHDDGISFHKLLKNALVSK